MAYRTPEAEQYVEAQILSNYLVQRANTLRGARLGSCVNGVRYFLADDFRGQIQGLAKNIPTNSREPEIGAVVVTREDSPTCPKCGHVAVVIQIEKELGRFLVFESNGSAGYNLAGTRWYDVSNPLIIGYLVNN